MSNPQNVRDFIKAFLLEEIVSNLDLENLKIIDTEKIVKNTSDTTWISPLAAN